MDRNIRYEMVSANSAQIDPEKRRNAPDFSLPTAAWTAVLFLAPFSIDFRTFPPRIGQKNSTVVQICFHFAQKTCKFLPMLPLLTADPLAYPTKA